MKTNEWKNQPLNFKLITTKNDLNNLNGKSHFFFKNYTNIYKSQTKQFLVVNYELKFKNDKMKKLK